MMDVERMEATEESVVEIGEFLMSTFAREITFGSMRTDNIAAQRAFESIWSVFQTGAVWAARIDGSIIGTLGLVPSVLWWTDVEYLSDSWFYVTKDHRSSQAALKLTSEGEAYAKEKGLPIVIQIVDTNDLDRKAKYMKLGGYVPVGMMFMKET